MTTRYTHRTGQVQYQRCPRAYLLNQHYQGKGIDQKAKPFEMLVGVYAHDGIAGLLNGNDVDTVVKGVLTEIEIGLQEGYLATYGCRFEQVKEELSSLVEGLLRMWEKVRLPYFLDEYEVVEVEKDRHTPLTMYEGDAIEQEFKLDALLKHKETGLYYVLSNKTTKQVDYRKQQDARTDVQGLSEVWGIEQALPVKINGVIMEYLITGRHEIEDMADGSKQWVQWSPLVRGWFNPNMPEHQQFAWKYNYEDESGKHRLTKGYARVNGNNIEGGLKAWVDALHNGEMFPGNEGGLLSPLYSQFVSIEYYRDEQDVVDWLQQTQAQERRVSLGLELLDKWKGDDNASKQFMNQHFPQHRHSCNYPGKCQFWEICWGSAGTDPFMNGFDWRVPHHQGQREQE